MTFGHTSDAHPLALARRSPRTRSSRPPAARADELTELALTAGLGSLDRLAAGTAIDAGGLVPDLHDVEQLDRSTSTRSTRSRCSRCSSATRPRRSS